jgi:hypothetical protein
LTISSQRQTQKNDAADRQRSGNSERPPAMAGKSGLNRLRRTFQAELFLVCFPLLAGMVAPVAFAAGHIVVTVGLDHVIKVCPDIP